MKLIFSENAWEDYLYWQKTDKRTLTRINNLIKDTKRNPFEGIGKPEPLKHNLTGYWSRRINEEDRMVYKAIDDTLLIAQLRYHY
ncbi:Txe/YoeB family addiction module toxin [Marinospirillum sp. MEB164]|jgi:toxin YoeB|uniref:Putative mRNA interferase YoeB n=1 Tax=Marinospirillum alkalitolerans TaxID=3123374 RepID=A0ABW8PZY4_9GAMM